MTCESQFLSRLAFLNLVVMKSPSATVKSHT